MHCFRLLTIHETDGHTKPPRLSDQRISADKCVRLSERLQESVHAHPLLTFRSVGVDEENQAWNAQN